MGGVRGRVFLHVRVGSWGLYIGRARLPTPPPLPLPTCAVVAGHNISHPLVQLLKLLGSEKGLKGGRKMELP